MLCTYHGSSANHVSLDPVAYVLWLASKYIFSECISPGKSSSFCCRGACTMRYCCFNSLTCFRDIRLLISKHFSKCNQQNLHDGEVLVQKFRSSCSYQRSRVNTKPLGIRSQSTISFIFLQTVHKQASEAATKDKPSMRIILFHFSSRSMNFSPGG